MNWIERIKRFLYGGDQQSSKPVDKPVAWSSMAALLEDLEQFGETYPEIYDTDVREHMWAVFDSGLIKQISGYAVPMKLGMFSDEANSELAGILKNNLDRLKSIFQTFGLDTEEKRRRSFFNPKLHTEKGTTVDEFFGSP